MFGAVDGALMIFFGMHITPRASNGSFIYVLQHTTWFWAFLKLMELIGAVSLLANYKPALGFALVIPISVVLCLFYVFVLQWFIACAFVLVLSIILFRAYARSYRPMLENFT